jgi:hypothetical protein
MSLIINPHASFTLASMLSQATAVYTPTIPTTGLYSHYDFSLLSDATGTSYSTNAQSIPNSSGLLIGAAAGTPALSFLTSGVNTPAIISSTAGGKKFISLAAAGSLAGGYLKSAGDAFPNVTSAGYSCIAVWRYPAGGGGGWVTPPYRYFQDGYAYDFNHLQYWTNTSGINELDVITAGASQSYVQTSTPNRNASSGIVIDMITVINTTVTIRSTISGTAATIYDFTGTLSSTPTYTTITPLLRTLDLARSWYNGSARPAINLYEFAFYSSPLTLSAQTSVFSALLTKWS